MRPRLWTVATLSAVVLGTLACGRSRGNRNPDAAAGASGSGGAGGACQTDATMAAVAAIVVRACATSGCHDSVTHEHGMDLSTADLIYANWVGKRGIDHCALDAVPRVVAGDPAASFVMTKVRGLTTCDLSKRMPPPASVDVDRLRG